MVTRLAGPFPNRGPDANNGPGPEEPKQDRLSPCTVLAEPKVQSEPDPSRPTDQLHHRFGPSLNPRTSGDAYRLKHQPQDPVNEVSQHRPLCSSHETQKGVKPRLSCYHVRPIGDVL